jgi:uncharacterized Zn-finger protein
MSEDKMLRCYWPDVSSNLSLTQALNTIYAFIRENVIMSAIGLKCDKKFKTSNQLREHMNIHLNDKKHKCFWPQCEYSCVQSCNLKKHIKIHLK